MPVKTFLAEIEANLKTGAATEHTYRPALKKLFDTMLAPAKAINEPKKAKYGAPDFLIKRDHVSMGHVEAKDVGTNLERFIADSEREKPRTSEGQQLKRYRANLPNLLYTDGLEWHWFVNGELRTEEAVRIATFHKAKNTIRVIFGAEPELQKVLEQFAAQRVPTINTPRDLAYRLAQTARWLCDVITSVFEDEGERGTLHHQLEAFRQTLLPSLQPDDFADMYAQTIVYGLFAARVAAAEKTEFSRLAAAQSIPKTNPFLRRLFQEIAGYDLDERIAWLVDDCAELLARTDMEAVLRDFGKATMRQDPVVHFYETFLSSYDPQLREQRGVYYTPEPVVSYIVRSVDLLLQEHFGKPLGLADEQTVILDPATGTATFLHAVVQRIYEALKAQGMAGYWNSYVPEKLLPRLFGFELLMAPYTVAHLKLGSLLQQYGYDFGRDERLRIYLTNALDSLPTGQQYMPFAQFIVDEGMQADRVKQDQPVMVVLGNPPYSISSVNRSLWINDLMESYKTAVRTEANIQPLSDDYIKFIRFAQWRIEQTGSGVIALITNHAYLGGIVHRGMRKNLLDAFDHIYLLNLHGNSLIGEQSPTGEPDENVFDIQQGVAIAILAKFSAIKTEPAKVHYSELWGSREGKYDYLATQDINLTQWEPLSPVEPYFFFVPKDMKYLNEYETYFEASQTFGLYQRGVATRRDHFMVGFGKLDLVNRFSIFTGDQPDEYVSSEFGIPSTTYWNLTKARTIARERENIAEDVQVYAYRPFDIRYVVYVPNLIEKGDAAYQIMQHMFNPNIALLCFRRIRETIDLPFFIATGLIDKTIMSSKDNATVFPLYLYPKEGDMFATTERTPNLSNDFIKDVEQQLGLTFVPDGTGDLSQTIGPEDIFHYIYAVFHNPTYRQRYAEFLKIDFPRVPLTSDKELFVALVAKGAALVDLHLLRLPGTGGVGGAGGAAVLQNPQQQGIDAPLPGDNIVDKVHYVAPQDEQSGRVYFNKVQYFAGIEPATWSMQIGGYQPLEKWLKDRKGRTLGFEDIQHYRRIVVALREMRRLMNEIDALIPGWPLV